MRNTLRQSLDCSGEFQAIDQARVKGIMIRKAYALVLL